MTYDFSNPELFNEIYIPLLYEDRRIRILYGSRDSGKSDFVAQHTVISMLQDDFFRMILLRKYYASIKQSQFQTIIDYIDNWELSHLFHITTNPLSIKCKENNNYILARGLDQTDNTKSIKDPTAFWFEEADQISEEAYIEASLSLRSSHNVKLIEWLTFNPKRASSWINKRFFPVKNSYEKEDGDFHWVDSTNPNTVILHTTYKDNRFCTPDRVEKLESLKSKDDNFHKVNARGLWGGALQGLIYPDWTISASMPSGGDEVFGLDYGFNNPSALVHVSYKDKRLYNKELLYITHHNHGQLVSLMVSKYKEYIGRKIIVVDNAEPALITALRNAGFNAIPCEKGPDSVYNGIMLVKQLELVITEDSPNIQEEAEGYIWAKDKDGKSIDEPIDIDNHACFIAGTKIETINGEKNIEDIKIGDYILTRFGYYPVLNCGIVNKNAEIYDFQFSNNAHLFSTINHPMILKDNRTKAIFDLIQSDILCILQENNFYNLQQDIKWHLKLLSSMGLNSKDIRILQMNLIENIIAATQIISNKESDTFTTKFGNRILVQSLKAIKSIIKMATRLIIQLKIYRQYHQKNICPCTEKMVLGLIKKNLKNISIQFDHLQLNGINLKKVDNGTQTMRKELMQKESIFLKYVNSVKRNFKQEIQKQQQNIVQTIANQPHADNRGLTTKKEPVLTVAKYLKSINIKSKTFVPNPAVRLTAGKKEKNNFVFNLTIASHHEYYANGILVHNCDAIRYVVQTYGKKYWFRKQQKSNPINTDILRSERRERRNKTKLKYYN